MFGKQQSSIDTQDGLKQQQRRYLNACVIGQPSTTADPATGTLCKYDVTYTTAILDNPKEWVLGIDRFNIPMLRVPRFIDPTYQSQTAIVTLTATNLGTNAVSVYPSSVLISNVLTPDPFGTGYIYLVTQWINAIQNSLNQITTAMNVDLSMAMTPPLLSFNASTGLITLQTQQGYFGSNNPTVTAFNGSTFNLNLYFNQPLWRFFPTFPQVFFNYSTAAAPLNTSQFYSKVIFSSTISTAVLPPRVFGSLPSFAQASGSITAQPVATLSASLVAGTSYTKLSISSNGFWLASGQAIQLNDGAGNTQTVFVGEGDCAIGATTLNTLMFTAVFAFPLTSTTVNIFSVTAIPLQTKVATFFPVGTQLTTGQTTFVLSRPATNNDFILYCTPVATTGENFPRITQSTLPYDTIVTESPVPAIWTSISSVRVKSTKIPLCMEFSPDIVTSASMTSTQAPVVPMVTDFVIDTSTTLQTADLVQFVTENPRWVDLVGDSPLYSIDLIVVWVDYQGNEHPVYIPAGYRFDMKVNFKRKYTKCLPGF